MFKFVRSKSVWLILPFYCCFRFLFSEISLRTFCSVWNFQGCITVYLSRCCSSQEVFLLKNICSVSQKAYLVYHKQFCLSRTFFIFIFKLLSKPGCLSLAATVQQFIRTCCSCQAVFYFFEFLFRNPCCFRSPQQSQSISGLFFDVKHFLNFFKSSCHISQ